jgi:osmoprotectant transport system substrate-binding protein
LITVYLILVLFVSGCGPSEEELSATATQEAAYVFATETAAAPTATATATQTPTPSPTPTETPTQTPTPMPTQTPTPSPSPTPDMTTFLPTAADLAPALEPVPPEMIEFFAGEGATEFFDGVAMFMSQDPVEVVMAMMMQLDTEFERETFDIEVDPEVMATSTLAGIGISSIEDENVVGYGEIPDVEDVGQISAGVTFAVNMEGDLLRWDLLTFRRGEVGVYLTVLYPDGALPMTAVTALAETIDARIALASSGEELPRSEEGSGQRSSIRIGSKSFTEQYLLGSMYELVLDEAGFDAVYAPMGGTYDNHTALLEGVIDLYPEYTGTALLTHLEMPYDPSMTREGVYETVKEEYEELLELAVLEPTVFDNTYCLAMAEATAGEMGISAISELPGQAGDLVLGTTAEFIERSDGLPGLEQVYGSFNFGSVIALDPSFLYTALLEGDIDVTTCFRTDGQLAAYDLIALEDDRRFWPPYPAAPVIRMDLVETHPEIAELLNDLSSRLDEATMQRLNWEVAANGRPADEVAREFLLEEGLLEQE